MKKVILASGIILFVIAMTTIKSVGQDTQESICPSNTLNDEGIKLFNGHNLDGWYTFLQNRGRDKDPNKVFTVQHGVIRISGEEWGCITTNNEYENYRLVTEFKWGNSTYEPRLKNARDCGILLHSQGEDGNSQGIWMTSIECQIIEGGTGDFIVVGDGSDQFRITSTVTFEKQGNSFVFQPEGHKQSIIQGRINWFGRDPQWEDILGFRGKNDIEKPVGEWNTLECVVKNNEISIYLNGILVNKATDVKPNKGRIQIQSESAEILFRRIDLIPIPIK